MRFNYHDCNTLFIQSKIAKIENQHYSPKEYGMNVNTQKKKKRGGAKKSEVEHGKIIEMEQLSFELLNR